MSYQTIKKLLVERLPRLKQLGFGCWVSYNGKEEQVIAELKSDYGNCYTTMTIFGNNTEEQVEKYCEILGHDFTHADLLKVLGVDWAMCADGQLMRYYSPLGCHICFDPANDVGMYPKLPEDLRKLDLPEHKETSERLISLITK